MEKKCKKRNPSKKQFPSKSKTSMYKLTGTNVIGTNLMDIIKVLKENATFLIRDNFNLAQSHGKQSLCFQTT